MSGGKVAAGAAVVVAAGAAVLHTLPEVATFAAKSARTATEVAASRGASVADDVARSTAQVERAGAEVVPGASPLRELPVPDIPASPQLDTRAAIRDVTLSARSHITASLMDRGLFIADGEIQRIVRDELANAAVKLAHAKGPAYKFEMLSGKLTIASEYRVAAGNITFGEVNVYKLSGIAAASIITCTKLGDGEYGSCIEKALDQAAGAVSSLEIGDILPLGASNALP